MKHCITRCFLQLPFAAQFELILVISRNRVVCKQTKQTCPCLREPCEGEMIWKHFSPFFFSPLIMFCYCCCCCLSVFFPSILCVCVCVCVCVRVRVCALCVHISPPTHSSEGKESVPWNWGSKCDKQYWRNKPDKPPTDRTTVEFLGGDGGRGINYRSAYDCATVSVFIWSKGQQLTTVLKVFCMAVQSF